MEPLWQGAIAGVFAGVAVALILGLFRIGRQNWARRQDVEYIRALLTEGRIRVLGARDIYNEQVGQTLPADIVRAGNYNNMLTRIGVALEKWAVDLSHEKRKDIYDALDWYNADGYFVKTNAEKGLAEFIQIPPLSKGDGSPGLLDPKAWRTRLLHPIVKSAQLELNLFQAEVANTLLSKG